MIIGGPYISPYMWMKIKEAKEELKDYMPIDGEPQVFLEKDIKEIEEICNTLIKKWQDEDEFYLYQFNQDLKILINSLTMVYETMMGGIVNKNSVRYHGNN